MCASVGGGGWRVGSGGRTSVRIGRKVLKTLLRSELKIAAKKLLWRLADVHSTFSAYSDYYFLLLQILL